MASLEDIFYHLVLPPKIPGRQDEDLESIQNAITSRLLKACNSLHKITGPQLQDDWSSVAKSLNICQQLNQDRLDKDKLTNAFDALDDGHILILYVVEQNAGLIIRRHVSDQEDLAIFESFEASPPPSNVLAAEDSLLWDFPGRSAQIPTRNFQKSDFQASLSLFLEQASTESLQSFAAKVHKAGAPVIEPRFTTDPALISQMLISLLEAVGSGYNSPKLRKRVRDDVNIANGKLPWRRLPFWLILRVSIQRYLRARLGDDDGQACYKVLVAMMFTSLLNDCVGKLDPELTVLLQNKLCRRLAKLSGRAKAGHKLLSRLLDMVTPVIKPIIESVDDQIREAWDNFKAAQIRAIPELERRAQPADLTLQLRNSIGHLQALLRQSQPVERSVNSNAVPTLKGTMKKSHDFAQTYIKLGDFENSWSKWESSASIGPSQCRTNCVSLSNRLSPVQLRSTIGSLESNSEQMSDYLLAVFNIWTQMDRNAIKECPLLRQYHPVFSPELLDVLHVSTYDKLCLLRQIQSYLRLRIENAGFGAPSILSEINGECFATRYFRGNSGLQGLLDKIEIESQAARAAKEEEWSKCCGQYEDLSQRISDGTCVCTFDEDGDRNIHGCTKCYHVRKRRRLEITVHEDFMPVAETQKTAITLELNMPEYLRKYRESVWAICTIIGSPTKLKDNRLPCKIELGEYSQLSNYMQNQSGMITLASDRKSFLDTHYKGQQVNVDLGKITLPNPFHFRYYDRIARVWVQHPGEGLSLYHLCGITLPSVLQPSLAPFIPLDKKKPIRLTSYEIVANQSQCPQDMSTQEFAAHQQVLSSSNLRWIEILRELLSPNLNFGDEQTMFMITNLVMQAGPAKGRSILGDIHNPFSDSAFCMLLGQQIRQRLHTIKSNTKEGPCMDLLLTLSLRLFEFHEGAAEAESLVQEIRAVTISWISELQVESRKSNDSASFQMISKYMFWAALVCRRTFMVLVKAVRPLKESELHDYVKASLALQMNTVGDPSTLSPVLKALFVRDVKYASVLRSKLFDSIVTNPEGLQKAICGVWSQSLWAHQHFLPWQHARDANEDNAMCTWVVTTVTSKYGAHSRKQVIHYNYVEGCLLIDGKAFGELPMDIRNSEDVKLLFGSESLQTLPSSLNGMTHQLTNNPGRCQIHFGLREGNVVISDRREHGLYQFVPRKVFEGTGSYDLPSSLLDGCVHWLNIDTGVLEIRQFSTRWFTRTNDWRVDLRSKRAMRSRVSLVSPHSPLASKVARIFQGFEDAHRLTIFQPEKGRLSVELKHLDLSFFVNNNNLLESRELGLEIDCDQNIHTLHGFKSMIVLREVNNFQRRSIILSNGDPISRRHGMHTEVRAMASNNYYKFVVDELLGRLSCAPEPRLLLFKAQLHALTSFVLPDRLTGRTGTEEASAILASGQCQPWQPLDHKSQLILKDLGSLCPIREYYPEDKKELQRVAWKSEMLSSAQNDCFYKAVHSLYLRSQHLSEFSLQNSDREILSTDGETHLRRRGEVQATRYARGNDITRSLVKGRDSIYEPRDRVLSYRAVNSYEIASIVWSSQRRVDIVPIKPTMADWDLIGGFSHVDWEVPITLGSLIADPLSHSWGTHVQFCKSTGRSEPYKVMFRLSSLAFSKTPDMNMIKTFAAIGCIDELRALPVPTGSSFNISNDSIRPKEAEIIQALASAYPQFVEDPKLTRNERAKSRREYKTKQEHQCRRTAQHLLAQWPVELPSFGHFHSSEIDLESALDAIKAKWRRTHRNFKLSKYIDTVQSTLRRFKGEYECPRQIRWVNSTVVRPRKQSRSAVPSLLELLGNANLNVNLVVDMCTTIHEGVSGETASMQELSIIIGRFIKDTNDPVREAYGRDLNGSLEAYKNKLGVGYRAPEIESTDRTRIERTIHAISTQVKAILHAIRQACAEDDDRFEWLRLTTLWPCMSPITILEQLRATTTQVLSRHAKEAIIGYGTSITILQKHQRILDAVARNRFENLTEEFSNVGHQNWKPLDLPDWLLLEIDGDILIRQEQVEVAHAIIAEGSSINSVLQLNMGRGKTSVILPMAAAILANKTQLARLIVPKALLLQTAQIMQSKLGVLVQRPIMHIPFSRRTPTSSQMISLYDELHQKLLLSQGVMITTPEAVLSFRLSGLQQLKDGNTAAASKMIAMQDWMTKSCRDILDESDYTLAVRTQLIYPSGSQETLDGHPHRWLVAQGILAIVEERLADIKHKHPNGIMVTRRGNGYPMSYFLNTQAEDYLKRLLIQDIANGKLGALRYVSSVSPKASSDVVDALSNPIIDRGHIKKISRRFTQPQVAFKCLHLLHGLLNDNVLISCLKKRWNVQYGLHETRDPIAVPFEAKGVPHPQAEFGHPDAAILLTCLSYYYTGVTETQMMQGLQLVLSSDDPVAEFDRWTGGCHGLPQALQGVSSINLEDQKQMGQLWLHMRHNKSVLNFFMNKLVFPIHAKQFSVKLQASGWDLPQFSPADGCTANITTGFSGTNDNKSILPLNIHQKDLPGLHHTNAEVLTYLLHPRNRKYIPAMYAKTMETWSEKQMLMEIHGKGIRILIDAGAYILDMDNGSVVDQWLEIDTQAKAAVYFKGDNRAWVKYRGKRKAETPLLATPFADKLEDCVVYLDQAHTRGTDMKFPPSAKGALTLALGQTKDHTVQDGAAMRLRQLKTTQSILFVAPPEVHFSIVDVCKKRAGETINSVDVVYWLLEQTCNANEQIRGLFFAQGRDYCRRMDAAHVNKGFMKNGSLMAAYLKVLEQPERQTLEEMYSSRPPMGGKSTTGPGEATAKMSSQKLKEISAILFKKCKSANTSGGLNVLGEVEQEREVEFQVEEVRDVRKPVKHNALKFPGLQKDLRQFVESGKLDLQHPFRHVITVASDTEIGAKHIVRQPSTRLFASTEFERTIELKGGQRNDSFVRPCEWILWSTLSETGIVIIREEAEELVNSLKGQLRPKVYLATYAAPVTKAMEALGRVTFYTIPSLPAGYEFPLWLPLELGIFAGRLYLDFESWAIIAKQLQDKSSKDDGKHEAGQLVAKDPRSFLLDWLTFRRRGQDILYTPMGYLCQGRQLTKDHAFFVEAVAEPAPLDKSVDSEVSASGTDDGKNTDCSSSEKELDD